MEANTIEARQILREVCGGGTMWTNKAADGRYKHLAIRVGYGDMTDEQRSAIRVAVRKALRAEGFTETAKLVKCTQGKQEGWHMSGNYVRVKVLANT